jgi:hypothetical protein
MPSAIRAQVAPENIDLLTRIIEAYNHLGIVSTLDRGQGLVIIRGTEDTCPELEEIIGNLPFPLLLE